tara:strand:+ start:46887 stop:47741 length:855 start_codon:yes stop_codon:yes gene_type:complete
MAIDYEHLMALEFPEKTFAYSAKDTMLYALSVGMGRDTDDLDYVYEKSLTPLPTLATVIAWDDEWQEATGMDISRVVHGGMQVILHNELPSQGRVVSSFRIREAYDKGAGRGAIVLAETALRDADSHRPLATLLSTVFARGDGGFGGPQGRGLPAHPIPEREPDLSIASEIRPEQALLYRLSGDMNPLHVDPEIAKDAGFDRPILQGLCTFGIAAASLVKAARPASPYRISLFEARFTAPVFPGDTLITDIWLDGAEISFQARVSGREGIALNNGRALISPMET